MLPKVAGLPRRTISSARWRCSSNSIVLAWIPRAREVEDGPSALSTRRTGILNLSSSSAVVMPVGPAPTIKIGSLKRVSSCSNSAHQLDENFGHFLAAWLGQVGLHH